MPYNPDLYPLTYPSALADSGASATDLAIQDLQSQVEAASVRQANLRRLQGRSAAAIQNAATSVLNALMPTNIVSGAPPAVVLGTKGFWLGGCQVNISPTVTIDRLTYNNESVSSLGSGLALPKWAMAGAASASNGYSAGGLISFGQSVAAIDRLVLSTEVLSTLGATLSVDRTEPTGTASATNAYFAAGYNFTPANSLVATIERLAFSNEAVAVLGSSLSSARGSAATGATPTNAYFFGGFTNVNPYGSGPIATIDRLLFSSETTSTLGAVLTRTKGGGACTNSSSNAYFGGGWHEAKASVAAIDRFAFASETVSPLGATLSLARFLITGSGSSVNGYFGGGVLDTTWTAPLSRIDRLAYSGESVSPLGTTLSSARFASVSFSNYTFAAVGA